MIHFHASLVRFFRHDLAHPVNTIKTAIRAKNRSHEISIARNILDPDNFKKSNSSVLGRVKKLFLAHPVDHSIDKNPNTEFEKINADFLDAEIKKINVAFLSEGLGNHCITQEEVGYLVKLLLNINKFNTIRQKHRSSSKFTAVLLDKKTFGTLAGFKHSLLIYKDGDDYKLLIKPPPINTIANTEGIKHGTCKTVKIGAVEITYNCNKTAANNLQVNRYVTTSRPAGRESKEDYVKMSGAELKALGFIKIVFVDGHGNTRLLFGAPYLGPELDEFLTRMGENLTEEVKRSIEEQILDQFILGFTFDLKPSNTLVDKKQKTAATANASSTGNKNTANCSDIKVTLIDYQSEAVTYASKNFTRKDFDDGKRMKRHAAFSLAVTLFQIANRNKILPEEMEKIVARCSGRRKTAPPSVLPEKYKNLPYANIVDKAYQEALEPEVILQELRREHRTLKEAFDNNQMGSGLQ